MTRIRAFRLAGETKSLRIWQRFDFGAQPTPTVVVSSPRIAF